MLDIPPPHAVSGRSDFLLSFFTYMYKNICFETRYKIDDFVRIKNLIVKVYMGGGGPPFIIKLKQNCY